MANQTYDDEDLIIVDEDGYPQPSQSGDVELASTLYSRVSLDSVPENRQASADHVYSPHQEGSPHHHQTYPQPSSRSPPIKQSVMMYSATNGVLPGHGTTICRPGRGNSGFGDDGSTNPHGLPEGVYETPIPPGVELPPGAILGSNHMVYLDGIPIGMLVEDDIPQDGQPHNDDMVEVRRVEPPPGVSLPLGTMLGSDGNIYNADRQVVGRLHEHGVVEEYQEDHSAQGPGPGPGHHRVKFPPGLQLPHGSTLWSDDNVYQNGHVIGRVHKTLAGQYVFDAMTKKITKITPPPGVAIPRGTFLGDDNNIYNNDGSYRGTLEELGRMVSTLPAQDGDPRAGRCPKGGFHNGVRKYTCEGFLCAVMCFPCGIICCLDWQDCKCSKCGRIIPRLDDMDDH